MLKFAKLSRYFPFLRWFPISGSDVKINLLAGLTVALVLIPQSMAYAQLAGLPAYYGLYAAFLPVAVASMWGSSNQLATGPVAVVSLLTASSIATLAAPGSDDFIALAIMLTLLVGVIQLSLGVFKLGVVVNFLSHPVIVGFTNAAAIIIALSQLSKILGVSMPRSESFISDISAVFRQAGDTHLPTLAMGVGAIALMWLMKRFAPKLPGVLIVVVLATLISWAVGFERNASGRIAHIADPELRAQVEDVARLNGEVARLTREISDKNDALTQTLKSEGESSAAVRLDADIALLRIDLTRFEAEAAGKRKALRQIPVVRQIDGDGNTVGVYPADTVAAGSMGDTARYSIRKIEKDGFKLVGGGEVVGAIPEGLPEVSLPTFDLDKLGAMFSAALVIALVGFMEAISIAKAVAAKTKQRLDPNQELIGQGVGNIVGSFTQSYPTSGSFSRTAVNMNMGATSGLSAVFTVLIVLITLLFLTPLLYHLPQAVLAAIIIMAVGGLVNIEAIRHAWKAHKHDGIASIVTFFATILFAPHLDTGILVGAGLAITLFLLRTMKPRVALLGRYGDGTLRDISVNPGLPTSPHVMAMRFDGSLYFANVSYFEDAVLEALAERPSTRAVLIVGDAINQLDASGEEIIHHLVERLRAAGVMLVFSGLKRQVMGVMRQTGLIEAVGEENIFATEAQAITAIYERLGESAQNDLFCPVKPNTL
ncbi:MAG: sodium-independent anion transporter [Thiobacillus sp. 65-69]|jgi:SulP family sulfate permease|nr:MAG: DNA repair protein [Thiobacillus sp. SCN 65-179]OJW38182.1 MAG: sodium-independent anion transporter [Thiobacillus sp. 65-69]